MALQIVELFGYSPLDESDEAVAARKQRLCPFLGRECTKKSQGTATGVCSVRQKRELSPVVCCPVRLYADNYEPIQHVADICFGSPVKLLASIDDVEEGVNNVVAFGRGLAGELKIEKPGAEGGGFSVDWMLAKLNEDLSVHAISAVEVQTIDTTGSYRDSAERLRLGCVTHDQYNNEWCDAGLNWENVNKRILPQLIYKGKALQRERLNATGLYFVCPSAVYARIQARLGEDLMTYPLQPGALTFCSYDIESECESGRVRRLIFKGMNTTTVESAANALVSPRNLPEQDAYERAITERLHRGRHRSVGQ